MTLAKWILAVAAVAGSLGVTTSLVAQPVTQTSIIQWRTNFDAAVAEAKSSSKPLLVLFTGSDWCRCCIGLQKDVLSKPGFAEQLGDKYVFVEVDLPMKGISEEQREKNKALQKKFQVSSFPTLMVVDPETQRPIGKPIIGYGGKGIADYIAQVNNIK
jgi:protein disulfide-isomerase